MTEQVHIIDNKRVSMTDSEWAMYQAICKSYDEPPHQQGRDFFVNLFESDEQGMITFLRPPTRVCSQEVVIFMINLMVHQRLRDCYKRVNEMHSKLDDHIALMTKRVDAKIAELDAKKETK
jgi:hypothetical protein